jgi:hypothetical protein
MFGLNHFIRTFLSRGFRLLYLRRLFFFRCAFQVQGKQPLQNLFVGQVGGEAVGGGDGGVQFLVAKVKPRGALVIKFRERALFQLGGAIGVLWL